MIDVRIQDILYEYALLNSHNTDANITQNIWKFSCRTIHSHCCSKIEKNPDLMKLSLNWFTMKVVIKQAESDQKINKNPPHHLIFWDFRKQIWNWNFCWERNLLTFCPNSIELLTSWRRFTWTFFWNRETHGKGTWKLKMNQ